ncbi:MAG: glycogen-binding domain-containing protein [Gemmatimonadaceae bacterium]
MHRRPQSGAAFVLSLLLALAPAGAGVCAQVTATLDAGTGSARWDDRSRSTVLTLAPALSAAYGALVVSAGGTAARFDSGGWVRQGNIAGSAFTPALGRLRGELAATAQGTAYRAHATTGEALGRARLHWVSSAQHGLGAWAGASAGHAWGDAGGRPVVAADGGAWAQRGGFTFRVSAGRTGVSAAASRDSAPGPLPPPISISPTPASSARALSYSTAEAGLGWARGSLELSATLGARAGERSLRGGSWGAGGTFWLTSYLGLVGSAGRYLPEPAQGLAGGRYATLAMRFGVAPGAGSLRPVRAREAKAAVAAREAPFAIRDAGDGRRTVEILAPGARQVELMGDFTDWQAVALVRSGPDIWRVTIPIAKGTHRLNIRVDGGAWSVPPGVTPLADEFLGTVGLIILE